MILDREENKSSTRFFKERLLLKEINKYINDERAGWSRRTFWEVHVSYKLSANRKDVVFGVLSERLW